MPVVQYQDSLEARVAFKRLTGLTIRLTPFELLTAINQQSDTLVAASIVTFRVDERRTEYLIKARGTKLIGFGQDPVTWTWRQIGKPLVVWDEDFEPFSYNLFSRGKSPAEWLAAREFARQCYRPGTSAQPLDSSYRTTLGYTTSKMERYW
jgi:hypothetical protein